MKKVYEINAFTGAGINDLLKGLDDYEKWLNDCCRKLVDRLADYGLQVAQMGFASATYDGVPDNTVTVENRGDNVRAVVATGTTVLFIEFGTGVVFPDTHPQAAELGMIRGSYGKGQGKNESWEYIGSPGSLGIPVKQTKNGTLIVTSGNPANMPMYEAVKNLEQLLPSIVKEVFVQ